MKGAGGPTSSIRPLLHAVACIVVLAACAQLTTLAFSGGARLPRLVLAAPQSAPAPAPQRGHQHGAYAVLSTGALPLYAFYLPIAALTWWRRLQVPPIILLVNDVLSGSGLRDNHGAWGSDDVTALVLRQLDTWGFQGSINQLEHDAPDLPANNAVVSQVARLHVASAACCARGTLAEALAADAYLITTDVDILPIAPLDYFLPSSHGAILGRVTNAMWSPTETVLHATCFKELPMSTIAFRASTWRRLMAMGNATADATPPTPACPASTDCLPSDCGMHNLTARLNADLREVLGYGYGAAKQLAATWSLDQVLVSFRLASQPALQNATELVPRDTASDRVDRSAWPRSPLTEDQLPRFKDAHVLRPGWTPANWERLAPLLRLLLRIDADNAADLLMWRQLEAYVMEFRSLVAHKAAAS